MVALSDGEQHDSFVSGFSGRCCYAVKSGICRGTEQARRRVRLQLCSAPGFVKIYRWLRSPWATMTTQVWQVKADGSVQSQDYTTSWGASKKFSVAFGSSGSALR